MPSRNDPATSLADILENFERIEGYLAGLDREAFEAGTLRHDAVERCLERIRDVAFRLGGKAAELVPSQPWAISVVCLVRLLPQVLRKTGFQRSPAGRGSPTSGCMDL